MESGKVPEGFVFRDGVNSSIVELSIEHAFAARAHVPERTTLVIRDDSDRTYTIQARSLANFPLFKNGLFIQETHCTFESVVDGVERRGVGVVEHAWHVDRADLLRRAPELLSMLRFVRPRTR
jgi:hypothetical protein